MPCPFPGMDPFVERREIWADFHDSLISYIRELLQPQLRPRYAALTNERLFVVEHERPIFPDVSIVKPARDRGGVALASPPMADTPIVIELIQEEVRQPLIHILEPAGNRVVTAIEVLSPDNKASGPGRESYLQKRDELWQSGTHLVEIDLLREGQRPFPVSPRITNGSSRWHYVTAVSRQPNLREFYRASLQSPLPKIGIPLAKDDADATLDLQAAFTRCWESGPYPMLLRYDQDPPGPLGEDDLAWCRGQVAG